MPLGVKVALGPGDIVLHGTQLTPPEGHSPPISGDIYCGEAVAHLSYC